MFELAEEGTNELEARLIKIMQSLKQRGNKQSLRETCNTFEYTSLYVMGVLAGKEREIGTEEIFKEIMPENVSNILSKNPLINTSKNLNKFQVGKMRRFTRRQILVKRQDKNILKSKRKMTHHYRGTQITLIVNYHQK